MTPGKDCWISSSYPTVGYVVSRFSTTSASDRGIELSYKTVVYDRYQNVRLLASRNSRMDASFSFLVAHYSFSLISHWLVLILHATTFSDHTLHHRILLLFTVSAWFFLLACHAVLGHLTLFGRKYMHVGHLQWNRVRCSVRARHSS